MKLLIILLLGATGALAQGCSKALEPTTTVCTMKDDEGDNVPVENAADCRSEDGCCLNDENKCMICDCPDNKGTKNDDGSEEEELTNNLFDQLPVTGGSRSLGILPPGVSSSCVAPVPFPDNCKPQRNEPFVLEPPNDVPYCVRIPCNGQDNSPYEKSHRACGMQPGCYFDKPLFEYREAFGPSVLPGVPVCHLAIRNRFFQTKAQEVVAKYGSWNPYFTNCVLQKFQSEIRAGPAGCPLIPVLEAFHAIPKMAGWGHITSYECALIDACWLPGRGCFYPVDISNVRVKSAERSISVTRKELVYGRPKCQSFDNSSPIEALKSYHRCRSAGCYVDYSVTRLYHSHLFSIGAGLSVKNHWQYWEDVGKGLVGPYNIPTVLPEYGYTGRKVPVTARPPTTTTFDPFGFPDFGSSSSGGQSVFSPPVSGGVSSPSGQQCGPAHRPYGGRPCRPIGPPPGKKSTYCPYKPFFVPRFKVLTGSFKGCCDINLCYLPKSEISKMHSGAGFYYTEWTVFSECSVTCGRGTQKRYRKCISQDRSLCKEQTVQVRNCFGAQRFCGRWSNWGQWSPCGRSCFPGGNQVRRRRCFPVGARCDGHDEEARNCNAHSCHGSSGNGFQGKWTEWKTGNCEYDAGRKRCKIHTVRHCRYGDQFASNCVGTAHTSQGYQCGGC